MNPLADLLSTWVATKRWCPSGGHAVAVELVCATPLFDPGHDAVVVFHLARAHLDSGPVLLSVPLTYRWWDPRAPRGGPGEPGKVPPPPGHDSVVGSLTLPQARELLTSFGVPAHSIPPPDPLYAPESGSDTIRDAGSPPPWQGVTVRDGVFDAAFTRAWVAALLRDPAIELAGTTDQHGLTGEVLLPEPQNLRELTQNNPRVITAEQSNSSAVVSSWGMVKLFRVLSPGRNPDVLIPAALSAQGWDGVPQVLAQVSVHWPLDDGRRGELADVAVLTQFLPGAEDGFELAVAMAKQGEDFSPLAFELGQRSGQMHRMLRAAFGSSENNPDGYLGENLSLGTQLIDQARWAGREVPTLADVRDDIVTIGQRYDAAITAVMPPGRSNQRIHGDYHLGQVLRSEDRWVVLDFEGEPLRPLHERNVPGDALRDVAGMLRSVDYAAAIGGGPPWWRDQAREGFLAGYHREEAAESGGNFDVDLAVHELVKALYEAVYESRSRPDWLPVPVAAIHHLVAYLNHALSQ